MSVLIKKIICDECIEGKEKKSLIFHIIVLYCRTLYSVELLNEHYDKFYKNLLRVDPKSNFTDKQLDSIRIKCNDPSVEVLKTACLNCYLAFDLDLKIVRIQKQNLKFITSDNPVVFYNQFLPFRRMANNTGLASKGLQVFFPVSPSHLVLLYDKNVYIETKNKIIDITVPRDVEQLNRLQFVSALHNIYFSENDYPADKEYTLACKYRRNNKMNVRRFYKNNEKENLTAFFRENIRTDLEPSFVNVLEQAKIWLSKYEQQRFPRVAPPFRDENLFSYHQNFLKLVKEKKYDPSKFSEYIIERKFSTSQQS